MNPTLTVASNPFALLPLDGNNAIAPDQLSNHWCGGIACGHGLAVKEQESFPAPTDMLGVSGFPPRHVDGFMDLDPGKSAMGERKTPAMQMLDSCYTGSSRDTVIDPSLSTCVATNSQPDDTTKGVSRSLDFLSSMTEPSSVKKRGRPRKSRTSAAALTAGSTSNRDATTRSGRRASTKSEGQDSASDDPKALRVREKNRIAADKCRSRRRVEEDNLKTQHDELEREHHRLSGALSELMAETYVLKNMLMEHGSCDCRLIQEYLKESASEWVAKKLSESTSTSKLG
ncbi:Metallophosphoesterase domain protein [Purpureocillium lavendulum]|uniref:Metallophosphoesterase domain protein n=1 Tax=Purpureocillium lavendulum TaxID=1247861 RepID=A0AB34FU27_9HYPO|nr:Metallophosphoesterase domain protein [Purpureocillium lavendulum]